MIEALQIQAAATHQAVTAGTPVNVAIPNNSRGEPARWVHVAATAGVGVLCKPVQSGDASASTTLALLPNGGHAIVHVGGASHLRVDMTATGTVVVTPLENQ
ncbi:MAG: hypothetical protein L0206_19050 [Actinobacteria bacterium]|nr:hypothetical protein [Actinomycetota bacterium]